MRAAILRVFGRETQRIPGPRQRSLAGAPQGEVIWRYHHRVIWRREPEGHESKGQDRKKEGKKKPQKSLAEKRGQAGQRAERG